MAPDSLTFKIAKHADIMVTDRAVTFRWCDYDGCIHHEDIGRTSIGRLLAKQLDTHKPPQCASDGTPYPCGFFTWTNGQRLYWLDQHRETVSTDASIQT